MNRYDWETDGEVIKIYDRQESNTKPIAVTRATRIAEKICNALNSPHYDMVEK